MRSCGSGLGGDMSLAEARFVCERPVTDAIRERGRAANSLRWFRPMPPAKAPARSGGALDRRSRGYRFFSQRSVEERLSQRCDRDMWPSHVLCHGERRQSLKVQDDHLRVLELHEARVRRVRDFFNPEGCVDQRSDCLAPFGPTGSPPSRKRMFSMPPAPFVGFTATVGSPGLLFGFAKNVMLAWVAMLSTVPSKEYPSDNCCLMTAWRRVMGSLTTSCMGTPLNCAGRGGRGGFVANGVLGFVAESGMVRSYCVSPGGAAGLSDSADPAAWRIGGAVGNVRNGVLLNDGNSENAYSAEGVLSVGGPEKSWAIPCASKELPCGIDPCRKTRCARGAPTRKDTSSPAGSPKGPARYEAPLR